MSQDIQSAPMTRHAERRSVDRNIPELACWLLTTFGKPRPAGGGTTRYDFDKKSWKELERFFGRWKLKETEQLRKVYLIEGSDGCIVTVAYRG